MLVSTHLALSNLPYSFQLDIPMSAVVKNISAWVNVLFTVVVLGEIFTTLIGNVFGIAKQLQSFLPSMTNKLLRLLSWLALLLGNSDMPSFLNFCIPYLAILD
ncbi:hypothetical protein AAAC51_33525 [Priestia megaterium]